MTPAPAPAPRVPPWTAADGRRLLAVTAAALVLFGYGLGAGTLWDQDEPRYAQVSREILQHGDPFTLRLDGEPWFVHPPLFFWLQALTGKALGFTELTVRLWSAISGAGVVAATFLLGRLLYDGRTGVLAAVVAGTTLQVVAQSRLAAFDPTLVAFMLLAVYMSLVGSIGGSRRAHLWAWVWAGLATAVKGPIGLLLPGMVIGGLWLVRREWGRWREVPLLGPVLYAAVGLHWYVIETVRHGEVFLRTAVGYYLLNRFFGVVENQPGPWWYYAPVLLLGTFPWTGIVPPAVAWLARRRRDLPSQVILLWCGITIIFYSVAGTKLPNYVLPVYPMLAIGLARFLTVLIDGPAPEERRAARWAAALLPIPSLVLVAAAVVYGRAVYPEEMAALRGALAATILVGAAGPLLAWGLAAAGRRMAGVAALALTTVAGVLVAVHLTLPAVEAHRPIPRLAHALQARMQPDDILAALRLPPSASLRFYAGRPVTWVESPTELAGVLCAYPRVFVIMPVAEEAWAARLLGDGAEVVAAEGGLRVHLKDGPVPCRPQAPP